MLPQNRLAAERRTGTHGVLPCDGAGGSDYLETLQRLQDLDRFGIRLGLSRMKKALSLLGDPHRAYPVILVGGTNGKGSVVAILSSILRESGMRVGAYTSPHLYDFPERVTVGGAPISRLDWAQAFLLVEEVTRKMRDPLTQFEFLTAMAFLYFARKEVELAVMEVGLGGRLDATNAAPAILSLLTNIQQDHTEILGHSSLEIAREKGGIIKRGGILVTTAQGEGGDCLRETARRKGSQLIQVAPSLVEASWEGTSIRVTTSSSELLRGGAPGMVRESPCGPGDKVFFTPLIGVHQACNLALALSGASVLSSLGYSVTARGMEEGAKRVRWPGRFELVSRDPVIILDGAHNPDGARSLREALDLPRFGGRGRRSRCSRGGLDLIHGREKVLIVGILREKDSRGILAPFLSWATTIILTQSRSPRCLPGEALREPLGGFSGQVLVTCSVEEACRQARKVAGTDGVVVVTGSLSVVAEARRVEED